MYVILVIITIIDTFCLVAPGGRMHIQIAPALLVFYTYFIYRIYMEYTPSDRGQCQLDSHVSYKYTGTFLLQLRLKNIDIEESDIELIDGDCWTSLKANPLALAVAAPKPTRRGTKGYKRRLNIRQRNCTNRPCNLIAIRLKSTADQQNKQRQTNPATPSLYYTNCRSLNSTKLDDLRQYANRYNPNAICLTETWFTRAREENTAISGYTCYTANRQLRVGGGAAIYLHSDINATIADRYTSPTVSAIWLKLCHPLLVNTIICCIYHPPSSNHNITLEYLENTLCKLMSKFPNYKIFIAGDFNCISLDFFCAQFRLACCVHFSTRKDACLDQILTNIDRPITPVKLPPLVGNEDDHCGIFMGSMCIQRYNYIKVTQRKITPSSKLKVLANIAGQCWTEVLTALCVDTKVEALNHTVTSIIDRHCPYYTFKTREDRLHPLSPTILKLMRARDRAFRYQKRSWKFLSVLVRRLLRNSKVDYVKSKLNQAATAKQWWKSIKQIENVRSPPVREYHMIDSKWRTTKEFVALLNNYFASVGGEREKKYPPAKPFKLEHVSVAKVKQYLNA
jgi:hypothetical protein